MKKKLGIISVIIFILSAALGIREYFFISSFFPSDTVTAIVIFFLTTGLPPVIGFILSFFSKKGALKITGIIGNGAVMMLTIVLPLVVDIFFPIQ
ncbi:hypothetical protein [Priestia endophytica]|uniref:ECF transporter S component n=1 Tax=Priestia endophytica DSM 13796 TaxID=1121089 RepID=A0A1I6BVG5_9BACI|nr:hypothetical protein [Priestia endophytica]KYG30392.1 hypothetical protein AZF06_24705 [Priestia endophytica]SFQ84920.1 hypothetical protein SAMN02745910_04315 [Priestia endophytica DSM 13796]